MDRPHAQLITETVLYRYFFYDWLFKDMRIARNVFEWRAFWLHNQAMRVYLRIYLLRWWLISAAAFALGVFFDRAVEAPVMAGIGFTGGSMASCVVVMIVASWALLSRPG
jgi:hypothetical protein